MGPGGDGGAFRVPPRDVPLGEEEAPALGKPIVVLRETTERSEIAELDSVKLVGSDPDKIFNASVAFLHESNGISPNYIFGNGNAADNIAEILRKSFYDN